MLLKKLITTTSNLGDINITGITCDSREVKPGYAFVCINGWTQDGHSYAQKALDNGAAVIVAERDLGIQNQLLVEDTHAAYAVMSANWFDNPAKKLKLVGVTGTNGKTSVTYMIKAALEKCGQKVGLIGTIQNMIGKQTLASRNTTPDAYELNSLLSLMVKAGCTCAVMEASSHALHQKRIFGMEFEVAVFTNLTQDHLDYHETMDNYLEAKRSLFKMCKTAVINADDEHAGKIMCNLSCKIVTVSAENDNSVYSAKSIKYRSDGVDYQLVGYGMINPVKLKTGGKFSVYNSMCAVVVCLEMGYPVQKIAPAIAELNGVKGRAEVVPCDKGFTVIIDYAHTPDGLENILNTFKNCEKNRLIAVFGCGGDRDKDKRPKMGRTAALFADFVVVTSDNPRTEVPSLIIEDILKGMKNVSTPYVVIEDRIQAIKYAIANAKTGDIIVLAGKGHETYQILADKTIHLDEREIVAEALAELK